MRPMHDPDPVVHAAVEAELMRRMYTGPLCKEHPKMTRPMLLYRVREALHRYADKEGVDVFGMDVVLLINPRDKREEEAYDDGRELVRAWGHKVLSDVNVAREDVHVVPRELIG